MRYSVIAARDGDVYHDSVEAETQEEADTKAREQLAEAWNMQDYLQSARDEGDESEFEAELDGFAVDPVLVDADALAAAGDALCELIEEAYTAHIYDPQNDEMPDPAECPYQRAISDWKAVRNG
jgi:hypothetical protein